MKYFVFLLIALSTLTACQSAGRYHQKVDSKPKFNYGDIDLADAVPRYEPYRTINSRPYTVFGRNYTPMLDGKGFVQEGDASWYGQKFHGHTTSNGEIYDMFSMTAAHKTLPLPSYVRVTNLNNNKTAVVRVNDRGPFHPGRVIDLSYAAAKKLDVISTGVAPIKLEVIHIDEAGYKTVGTGPTLAPEIPTLIAALPKDKVNSTINEASTQNSSETSTLEVTIEQNRPPLISEEQRFIQIAAVSQPERAKELSETLAQMYQVKTDAPLIKDLYRVRLGPIKTEQKAEKLIEELKENGFDNAFQVLVQAE